MTEEKKQEHSAFTGALPLTLVLALLAGLIFKPELPYQDERPSNKPVKYSYTASQDVDARLWQDPFAAIDGIIEEPQKEKVSPHSPKIIYEDYQPVTNDKITIIAITLPGGPYQEAAEIRMRRRYAILSALANQNGIPQDEQHIGYFHPKTNLGLQKKVSFEWWSLEYTNSKFLLLWVDESSLLIKPADKLRNLLIQATSQKYLTKKDNFNYAVIGPNSSRLLLDMLKEIQHGTDFSNCSKMQNKYSIMFNTLGEINCHPINYFSAGATASDPELLRQCLVNIDTYKNVSEYLLLTKGITLYRTTATDLDMMMILVNELNLRLNNKPRHVVILSEWDTYYGRLMPKAFEVAWRKRYGDNFRELIYSYSYMRGLDGKLPDKSDNTFNAMEKSSDSKNKDNNSNKNSLIEFPEGHSQKDYLRRLADQIHTLDQNLKINNNQLGIYAIGILGSDVHDKLMILEALRQHFPHKLFFTTDLDATFFHPAKRQQTHNLLVASAFDLKLRSELQHQIPPFRDSYQTAFFLATQLILNPDKINPDKKKIQPLLFEIGRNHPILLPENGIVDPLSYYGLANDNWWNNPLSFTTKNSDLSTPTNKSNEQCSSTNLVNGCDTVQPYSVAASTFSWTLERVITFVIVVSFFSFVSSWFRKNIQPFMISIGFGLLPPLFLSTINSSDWLPRLWALTILALLIPFAFNWFPKRIQFNPTKYLGLLIGVLLLITPPLWNAYIIQPDAEPFYWREGISIWPSQILRLSVVLFASLFFYWGQKRINRMLNEFHAQPGDLIPSTFALPNHPIMFGYWKVLFVGNWNNKKNKQQCVIPQILWREYLGYFGFNMKIVLSGCYWRTVMHSIVFWTGALMLIMQSGLPNIPARGDIALDVNKIIIFSAVLSTILLITWVVENARLCERLITHLSEKPSRWHEMAKNWALDENKFALECVDDWLDIQMVARLTATIQPLIIGPVVCIALLLIARSPIIDDWDLPWGLGVIFFAMLLYSISAELFLQHGAKIARKKAIIQLAMKISEQRNQNTPNDFVIKRIETQIERIRNLCDGAFRPWYKWPLLQSFGGLSTLVVVLQYLAGTWGNGNW